MYFWLPLGMLFWLALCLGMNKISSKLKSSGKQNSHDMKAVSSTTATTKSEISPEYFNAPSTLQGHLRTKSVQNVRKCSCITCNNFFKIMKYISTECNNVFQIMKYISTECNNFFKIMKYISTECNNVFHWKNTGLIIRENNNSKMHTQYFTASVVVSEQQ